MADSRVGSAHEGLDEVRVKCDYLRSDFVELFWTEKGAGNYYDRREYTFFVGGVGLLLWCGLLFGCNWCWWNVMMSFDDSETSSAD